MALTIQNTDAISFKKLSGKAHTDQNFAVSEESISTNIQLSYTTVFAQPIEPLPITNSGYTGLYSGNGIIQRVKFQVDIIPNTQLAVGQSQGYRLKLPSDWNSFGKLYPQYSAGTYLHTALGRLQIVPALYGKLKGDGSTEYDPILFQTDGVTQITKFDAINWYFDPYDGVVFVEDPKASYDTSPTRPGFLEAFLYVGKYLNQVVSGVTTGGTTPTGSTNITVNNGLTKSGTNITLGGTITGNTLIGQINTGGILFDRNQILGSDPNSIYIFDGNLTGNTGTSLSLNSNSFYLNSNYGSGTLNVTNYNSNFSSGNTAIVDLIIDQGISENLISTENDKDINHYSQANLFLRSYSGGTCGGSESILQGATNAFGVSATTLNFVIRVATTGSTVTSKATIGLYDSKYPSFSSDSIFAGLEYDHDYSANYSPRSLVDKAWVLSQITTGNTGGSNTLATNGLTKIGNTIVLGGTLTGNTTIGLGTNNLTFTGTTATLKYGSDLSANFTARSIPDVGYVTGITNQFNGQIITASSTGTTSTDYVAVSATTAINYYLPASPKSFQVVYVSDIKGNAGTFNITINGNGKNINGTSTAVINVNYATMMFVWNGFNWAGMGFLA